MWYREIYSVKFDDARKSALEILNACLADIIGRFFNHSWRFMDAYRVRKQKSHRRVGPRAMMSVDSVDAALN